MEDDSVIKPGVGEPDDAVRRAPCGEVEELEHHLAEARDLHAEAPVVRENGGGDESVARLDAESQRSVPLRIQGQQERRTPEERDLSDRRQCRLRGSDGGKEGQHQQT